MTRRLRILAYAALMHAVFCFRAPVLEGGRSDFWQVYCAPPHNRQCEHEVWPKMVHHRHHRSKRR